MLGLNEDDGGKVLEALTGYSLLTPLKGEPKIARIHRLVADSLDNPEESGKIIAQIRKKCYKLLGNDEHFWSVPENIWNITPVSEFLNLLGRRCTIESPDKKIDLDLDLTRMMGIAGGILQSINKMNEALEVYKLRFEICKKRVEVFPDNYDVSQDYSMSCNYLRDLGDSLIRLSEKEQSDGNPDAAKDWCEKALGIYKMLAETMPENVDVQRTISVIYSRLGNLNQDAGNADAAKELFAKSQEIIQRLQLNAASDNNVASEKTQFDYYISYAHIDNQSIDGQPGFVDTFVEKLRNSQEHQKLFGGKVSVYFDKNEIHSMSDWENCNRFGLSHSRFLIVLVSPNYFKSEYCAREFDWWMKHEMHRRMIGESFAPMLIAKVAGLDDYQEETIPDIPPALQDRYPNWLRQLRLIQSGPDFDMHDLERAKIDKSVQALSRAVKDKVFRLKIAESSLTNAFYPHYNENFVGRRENLVSMRTALSTQTSVAVCALTGLGGIGKTELALTYGHAFAWDYELGRVFVNCENMDSLEDVILSSGIVEMHGLELEGTNEQQLVTLYNALEKKIKLIQQRNKEKKNVDRTLGAHVLLILDNVNRLELIASKQLRMLPDYFHVIITTRESTIGFSYIYTEMVDCLSEVESLELLNNLRPFDSPQESIAARNIARILDGFPLAIELTGEYLRRSPRVTYQEQYERMNRELSQSFQEQGHEAPSLKRHQMETVSMILMVTLSKLTPNARKALNFASQMAPDAVGLNWLPKLIGLDDKDRLNVIGELIGFNLLTPLEKEPNIARIHRLVADSVKQYIPEEECKEIIDDIRDKCNDLLEEGEQFWYTRENSWNIIPVSEFLKMLAEFWTVETSDEEIDWDLTEMLNTSGDILKNLGKIIDAQDVYNSLYGICQKRAEFMPENVQVCLDLSNTCNKLGDLKNASGNTASAREWYEKALEISHRLADKMPDSVDAQRNLSVSYCKLGDLEDASGNTAAAREWYEKALEINKRLTEKQPEDVTVQRNLSFSYCKLGDMEFSIGNIDASREWFEKALEIRKRLACIMPENVDAQRDLSDSYYKYGDIENAVGNAAAAREWYEKSLEISKRLAELMPDNVDVQRDLSVSCNRLGNLEQDAGNVSTARDWYEKSLEISKRLADLIPDNVRVLRDLSVSCNRLGDLEKDAGNADSAMEWYEKSLKIRKWLADKMPENVDVQLDLSDLYNRLGNLEQNAGNDAASREWFEKALDIYQQLARKMPENVRVQNELQSIQRQIPSLEESQTSSLESKTISPEESQTPSMESKAISPEESQTPSMESKAIQEDNAAENAQAQKELDETREKLAQAQKALAEMQEKLAQAQKPWYIKLLNKLFGKD